MSTEQSLHRQEAHNWCEAADRQATEEAHESARTFAAVSQAHASLAIAEQLERLNDQLGHVIAGEGPGGFVKVRNDA